jgi:hypothetical protein
MHVVKSKKRLTDETIITALVEAGSIKEAAGKLHCTPRTIYDRMKKPAFRELYNQAKGELMKTAAAKLQGKLTGAIDTLVSIMTDKETAAQTRANCAVSILQYGARFAEATDIIERLEALEAAQAITDEAII